MFGKREKGVNQTIIVATLGLVLATFLTAILFFSFLGGIDNSRSDAYAEVNPNSFTYNKSTQPTITVTPVGYNYATETELNTDNRIVVDISNPDVWASTSSANASSSLLAQIGLKFTAGKYNSTSIGVSYTDAGNTMFDNPNGPNPEYSTAEQIESDFGYATFIDSSTNSITAINVSGKTWYGETVTDFNILSNGGKNAVAGFYTITSVTVSYTSPTFEYIKGVINASYYVSRTSDGTQQPPQNVTENKTYTGSNVTLTVPSESQPTLFLTATIEYGASIAGLITNQNLGINASYDSETEWDKKIFLYDENVSSSASEGENCYYYSYTNDSLKKDFSVSYGLVSGLTNTTFSIAQQINASYSTIASHLKLVWYAQRGCTDPLESFATIPAGEYFIRIEVDTSWGDETENNWIYELEGTKYYIINFKFSGSDYVNKYHDDNYIQPFTVQKKLLRISFKDSLGVSLVSENGLVSANYSEPYTQVNLANSQARQSIPNTETFYEMEGGVYKATTESKFVDGKTFFRNKCPIGEIVQNEVTTLDKWKAIGGCENDWHLVEGSTLFGVVGSYFPGTQIKEYDYFVLFLYIEAQYIGDSYEFDLGEESSTEGWISYADVETSGQTRLIAITTEEEKRNEMTLTSSSVLRAYEYYDPSLTFAVVAPRLDIELGGLLDSANDCMAMYGEIWSSSEIDYSGATISSASAIRIGETSTYDLKTADTDWCVKIIGNENEMVASSKNFIYVLLSLAKENLSGTPGSTDYQADRGINPETGMVEDGKYYTPYNTTLYGGIYYIIYTAYYKLKGDTSAVPVNGIKNGKVDIKKGEDGIATLYLKSPAVYTINKVNIYLELQQYTPDKYYDGTEYVLREENSQATATAKLKQMDGYTLSDAIKNIEGQNYQTILDYDLQLFISYDYAIRYDTMLAGDSAQTISCVYELQPRSGATAVGELLKDQCYDCDPVIYYEGIPRPDLKGLIKYRTLDINILEDPQRIKDVSHEDYVEAPYSRSYGKATRIAVRVAKYSDKNSEGQTLRSIYESDPTRAQITEGKEYYADYYYYFPQNSDEEKRYYFYSELPDVFKGACYILCEIGGNGVDETSGFLTRSSGSTILRDGFDWDETDSSIVKFYINPQMNSEEYFDPADLFVDWEAVSGKDANNNTITVTLNEQTDAGKYRIPFNSNVKFINYKLSVSPTSTISAPVDFEITKIKLDPEETLDLPAEGTPDSGRYLVYSKQENISKVFTSNVQTSFVNLQHPEYNQIVEDERYPHIDGIAIFSSLVEVVRFWLPMDNEIDDVDPMEEILNGRTPMQIELDVSSNPSLKNMTLAGWYYVKVSSPETTNYKSTYRYRTVRVHRKTVEVYTTVAIRTYMEIYDVNKEVHIAEDETVRKELTSEQLSNYIAYLSSNTFEISTENDSGTPVYVYYSNEDDRIIDTSAIHIYYVGFAEGDTFVPGVDTEAVLNIDLSSFYNASGEFIDKAGAFDVDDDGNRILYLSGAKKQNYTFNYIMGTLYIKRQSLILKMEDNQTLTYTGDPLSPDNTVETEEGGHQDASVVQFIAAYYAYVDGQYRIFVRDYENNLIVEAEVSTSPAESDQHDYYYYFQQFFDVDSSELDVKKTGTDLVFEKGGITYKLYEVGTELFYYQNNDSSLRKHFISKKTTYIYRDGSGFYYYADNDESNVKTYLTEEIEPDFEKKVDGKAVLYVDEVDGKKIYIGINESEQASSDGNVIDVFYYERDNVLYQGGYILKLYAEPSGSSANYRRTGTYVAFLKVDTLEIDLIDNSDTFEGTTVNPIQLEMFNDKEFVLGSFGSYYEGKTIKNETVFLQDGWANVEIYTVEGVKQFASLVSSGDDFVGNATNEFAMYQNGDMSRFVHASSMYSQVLNAGLYVILMKVTISDSYGLAGQSDVNMRKNIRFASTSAQAQFNGSIKDSTEDFTAYFVLYLIMDRSGGITVSPYQDQTQGDTGAADPVSAEKFGEGVYGGLDGYYVKMYNGKALSMDVIVNVVEFTPTDLLPDGLSSNGEIVNIRQYISVTPDYTEGSYEYYRKSKGERTDKWIDNLTISLIHVNIYYITFIINYNDLNDSDGNNSYNNNYDTLQFVYQVKITPRPLSVNIHTGVFDENENEYGYKNYGQKNSDVVKQFTITYGDGDSERTNDLIFEDEFLRSQITVVPTIDWDTAGLTLENPENPAENDPEGQNIVAGSYYLNTKGGKEPSYVVTIGTSSKSYTDYTFIRNGGFSFVVRKLQFRIGGDSYPLVDIALSGVYNGAMQNINITKYGWDRTEIGDSEMVKPIAKSSYPSYLQSDIGNVVKQFYYVGPIENYDPMIHTRNYFNSGRVFNDNGEEIGGPAYDLYWDNHENGGTKVEPVDVGYYLFYVIIPDSTNYLGVDVGYWIYEVEKYELTLEFYNPQTSEVVRGYSSRTYSGEEGDYPIFYVKYSELQGEDNFGNSVLTGEEAVIKFKPEEVADGYTVQTNFGLINPLYYFVDEYGERLKSGNANSVFMPVTAGMYFVKLALDEENGQYGWAKNYRIVVEYAKDDDGHELYPQLEITRRLVGVTFEDGNTRINKTYDGTEAVVEGSVEPANEGYSGNYTFTRRNRDIGLVPGDSIALQINYAASRYARKDVLDEYGRESDIPVYLVVESELRGADANNYTLSLDQETGLTSTIVISETLYVLLVGKISRAMATVRFLNDNGQSVTTRRVVYNGMPQAAIVVVEGVNGEVLLMENGDYNIRYSSSISNYDNEEPPTNCDLYNVLITVTNSNYLESPSTSYLEINRANVEIVFGGEGVQMYGNVTFGLTATANGVADYAKALTVLYYYINEDGTEGDIVEDISLAPAGRYIAAAIHTATDNYNYKRDTELFTISQRDVYVSDDVFASVKYTGESVNIKIYFVDNGNIYYPQLLFDKWVNGQWSAANYSVDEQGHYTIANYPSTVGKYRVKANEYYSNFHITDAAWREFTIEKADLIVKVDDLTVTEGDSYDISSSMKNCLTKDNILRVVSGMKYKFYNASTNEYLSEDLPRTAGTYKVIGYDGVAENYNITYQFGLLTINKSAMDVEISSSGDGEKASIVIEGSFGADVKITVSEVQNTEYSAISDAFEIFKINNTEFAGFTISKVFVFEYTNYTTIGSGASMKIRLHIPGLLSTPANAAWADGDVYYVALLGVDGDMKIVEATVDGEYLSFEAGDMQIKAISVLTMQKQETDAYDWLLYVGIALGVVLIAVAIVIVVKRA